MHNHITKVITNKGFRDFLNSLLALNFVLGDSNTTPISIIGNIVNRLLA
jgi:hypothetical protein